LHYVETPQFECSGLLLATRYHAPSGTRPRHFGIDLEQPRLDAHELRPKKRGFSKSLILEISAAGGKPPALYPPPLWFGKGDWTGFGTSRCASLLLTDALGPLGSGVGHASKRSGGVGGSSVTGASLASPNSHDHARSLDPVLATLVFCGLPARSCQRWPARNLSPPNPWLGVVCYTYSSSTSTPVTQLHSLRFNMLIMTRDAALNPHPRYQH
jgi:hypothetical protein